MNLRLQLLALVLAAAVPVFAVQVYDELQQREQRRAEIADETLRLARLVADQQERVIDGARYLLALAAELPSVRNRDGPECSRRMMAFKRRFPEINAAGAIAPDGTVFCFSAEIEPFNIADREYFQKALQRKTFTISGYVVGRQTDSGSLPIVYPVLNEEGEVQVVVAVAFNLKQLAATLSHTALPSHAVVNLIDRDGVVLARVPAADGLVGQPVNEAPVLKALLTQREGTITAVGSDGTTRIFGIAPITDANLFAVVGLPRAEMFAAADQLLWQKMSLLAGIFVLAAAAALIGGELSIRRPIAALQRASQRLATGELAARMKGHSSTREIAALAGSFDEMARSLQHREHALRESEQRFRDMAESASDWFWEADADLRFTYFSGRLGELTGLQPEAVIGKRREDLITEIEPPSDLAAHLDGLASHRPFRSFTYWIDTPTGRRCFNISGKPVFDQAGGFRGYRGTGADITDQKRAEKALREETHTLEIINRINTTLMAELDIDKLVQAVTDAATELTGAEFGAFFYNVADADGESYMLYCLSGVPREAFAKFPQPRNTAVFGPTFRGEGVVRLDDVTKDPRYGQNAPYRGMPEGHLPVRSYLAVPVVSRSGEVIGGLFFGHSRPGIFTERAERIVTAIAVQAAIAVENARLYRSAQAEIGERKRTEERQALLMAELDHRVKNILATVQSVAGQTLPTTDAAETFRGRLAALAHAHSLLAASRWEGARLCALLEEELAPYQTEAASRVTLAGDDVLLTPRVAQTLALTMHELTTNAVKYGALSSPEGRVDVAWTAVADADGRRLRLVWAESGGPPVVPPARRGFGTMLVEHSLTYEMGGDVRLELRPEGARCEIDVPLRETEG